MADDNNIDVDTVFRNIVKRPHGGRIAFKYLRMMNEFTDWQDVQIIRWFRSYPDKFVLFERDNGRISMVAARIPSAKLCSKVIEFHPVSGDERLDSICDNADCPFFHICRQYLAGRCDDGVKCPHDHHFQSDRSRILLKKYGFEDFENEDIRIIVAQSQLSVCNSYNRQNGQCNYQDGCTRLHICEQFVRGNCGDDCHLNHSLSNSEHTRRLVRLYWLDARPAKDALHHLLVEWRQSKNPAAETADVKSRQQHPTSPASATETAPKQTARISVDFTFILLRTSTVDSKTDKAVWQAEIFGEWTDFNDETSQFIEDKYCDPAIDSLCASLILPEVDGDDCKIEINFDNTGSMTAQLSLPELYEDITICVKRLKNKDNWLWYWQSDDNSWIPYIDEDDQLKLEEGFQSDLKRGYACKEKYRIKYIDWSQKNRETGKIRKIRRRPLC